VFGSLLLAGLVAISATPLIHDAGHVATVLARHLASNAAFLHAFVHPLFVSFDRLVGDPFHDFLVHDGLLRRYDSNCTKLDGQRQVVWS